MSQLTVSEYSWAIEACAEYLGNHKDEWWILDIIQKLQLQRAEAVKS